MGRAKQDRLRVRLEFEADLTVGHRLLPFAGGSTTEPSATGAWRMAAAGDFVHLTTAP